MGNTILIVEDDVTLCRGIALSLQNETNQVLQAGGITEATRLFSEKEISLVVLDINLPDGNGLDFCSWLRKRSEVPVLFLSANDLETDIVSGLALGGDDYITKPFSLAVLRARVAALLRRSGSKVKSSRLQTGPFEFDFEQLYFTKNGREVFFSRTEQKLLQLLVSNPGITLPREVLLDKVYGTGEFVEENALSVTVRRLRNKLEEEPSKPRYIKTVYGIGYTWAVAE